MSQAQTKDEKFLVSLYLVAKDAGDQYGDFNKYDIGHRAGLHPKGVDAICKELLRANFIKKTDEELIYITEHGESLAKRLLFNHPT